VPVVVNEDLRRLEVAEGLVSAVPVRVTEVAGSQFRRVDWAVEARILSANSWRLISNEKNSAGVSPPHQRGSRFRGEAVLPVPGRAPTMVILLAAVPENLVERLVTGLEAVDPTARLTAFLEDVGFTQQQALER